MTCLGVLERGERGDDNEIGLKEEGVIEMSTTVLHSRTPLLRLNTYRILSAYCSSVMTNNGLILGFNKEPKGKCAGVHLVLLSSNI